VEVNYIEIDYEHGTAKLWTKDELSTENWDNRFYHYASQCFGIRKSIGETTILCGPLPDDMPKPWCDLPDAHTLLQHSGDTIVWDIKGEKIKTEWD
jgi:hypothetical protein